MANEGYFPHVLPLKEGSEGDAPHLHFSLHFSLQHNSEVFQLFHMSITEVKVSFICF